MTDTQQKRELAIELLAKESGFNDTDVSYTKGLLGPFFDLIVKKCADAAEETKWSATVDDGQMAGAKGAAAGVRFFGSNVGN